MNSWTELKIDTWPTRGRRPWYWICPCNQTLIISQLTFCIRGPLREQFCHSNSTTTRTLKIYSCISYRRKEVLWIVMSYAEALFCKLCIESNNWGPALLFSSTTPQLRCGCLLWLLHMISLRSPLWLSRAARVPCLLHYDRFLLTDVVGRASHTL